MTPEPLKPAIDSWDIPMELTDEQRRILDEAIAQSDGDEAEIVTVEPNFFQVRWKRSGYYEGFQTGPASEPLKPAIDSAMTDEEIQALIDKHRYLLDRGDGGYLCDMAPDAVRAYTKAVLSSASASHS